MKKTLIITLSLFVPFLLLAQRPYPYVEEYDDSGYVVFKDSNGKDRSVEVRDEVIYDDSYFAQKKCPVPAALSISNQDIEQGEVDLATAKSICASKTEFTSKSDWKWRLPTKEELKAIYSLEQGDDYFADDLIDVITIFLSDIEGYQPLNRDKYWVSTTNKEKPTYLDLTTTRIKSEETSQDNLLRVRCVRDLHRVNAKFQDEGLKKFRMWVLDRTQYPEAALKKGIEAIVSLQFYVDKAGDVTSAKPIKIKYFQQPNPEDIHLYDALVKEAIETVKSSPKWTPATINGHLAKTRCTVPVAFQVE